MNVAVTSDIYIHPILCFNSSNMKTWTIVNFLLENAVEAVPTAWIIGNNQCYWPPWTAEKLTAAIKKSDEPNSCWPLFKVECFRNSTYDNYWLARSKARKAEETSDLNSESGNQLKRIRKKKILSSPESENELQFIKSPPKIKKSIPQIATTSLSQEVGADSYMTPHSASSSNNKSPKIAEKEYPAPAYSVNSPTLNDLNDIPTPTTSRVKTVASINNNSRSEFQSIVCSCCPVHNNGKYLKEILQQNHLLRALLGDISVAIHALKENQGNTVTESFFNKFNFPLKSSQDFKEFENYLEDPVCFANAVTEISKVGGSSPYNFIKRAMSMLIANEMAVGYSWLGRKGKSPFHLTQIAKLLIGAADEGHISKSRKDTELAMASWLKRANERKKNTH